MCCLCLDVFGVFLLLVIEVKKNSIHFCVKTAAFPTAILIIFTVGSRKRQMQNKMKEFLVGICGQKDTSSVSNADIIIRFSPKYCNYYYQSTYLKSFYKFFSFCSLVSVHAICCSGEEVFMLQYVFIVRLSLLFKKIKESLTYDMTVIIMSCLGYGYMTMMY